MGYKRNAVDMDLHRELKYHWPPRKGNTSLHVIDMSSTTLWLRSALASWSLLSRRRQSPVEDHAWLSVSSVDEKREEELGPSSTWRIAWPKRRHGLPMCGTCPERNVTMIASSSGRFGRRWNRMSARQTCSGPSEETTSKTWLATCVDAKVEIEDPKTNLKILSWNSGGILTRIKDIQRLLAQTQPHLLLLQEARSINGNHNALGDQCRAVGYSKSPPRADGLVCVWLRGVSVAPLKNPEGEKHMRIQRIAVLLAERGLLIRHIHVPSQAGLSRCEFFEHLECDLALNGITAGDFNCRPIGNSLVRVLSPDVATFRPDPAVNRWVSCIDGFVVPMCLVNSARVSGLEAVPCAQHRPILLELSQKFRSHDIIEWNRPPAMDLGSWAPGALDEVREAIECNDTDRAWRCWAEAIGFTSLTTEPRRLNEGWTCGKCHHKVHKLWKRLRQFQSDCSVASDRKARDILAALCDLLETHAASRLED